MIKSKKENKNNIISFSRDILVSHKKSVFISTLLLVISGLLDAFGLSLIAPTVSLLINEKGSTGFNSEIISNLKNLLDFLSIPYSLRYILGLIAIIMLLRSFFIFAQNFYTSIVQHNYTSELGKKYHQYLNSLSWHSFKEYKQAASINVFSESVRAGASLRNYVNLISNFFGILIYIIFLSIISFKMTIVSVILSIFILIIFYRLIKISNILGKRQSIKAQQILQDVSDSLNLAKYLRTHGKTNFMTKKLFSSIDSFKSNQIKLGLNESVFQASYEYAFIGFLMLGLLIAARFFELPSSTIALVTIILYRLFQKIKIFQQSYQSFNKTVPGHFTIKNEISKKQYNADLWGKKRFIGIKEYIEFENASFSVDGRKILSNLNCKFERNKINVIIGKSGSGKTTLVNIILGIVNYHKGEIIINNQYKAEETNFNNLTSYTPQDLFLINASIEENIALGIEKYAIDKNKMKDAIKKSGLERFINKLPEKSQTRVNSNILNISGGQAQRIAIARNFYYEKKINIFDEFTSALDEENEDKILKYLKKTKNTIIIVSHKNSSLKYCNKIYEMKNGKLLRV